MTTSAMANIDPPTFPNGYHAWNSKTRNSKECNTADLLAFEPPKLTNIPPIASVHLAHSRKREFPSAVASIAAAQLNGPVYL